MFVNAPKPSSNGTINTVHGELALIVPYDTSPTQGYASAREALAQAFVTNATVGSSGIKAQGSRAEMQSGIDGYKRYRNTGYRASYMKRSVLVRDVTLYKSSTRNRFVCESLPIGLGYTGGNTTGWLDDTGLSSLNPNGSSGSAWAIYNRAVAANLRNRGIVECKLKMLESKMDLAESLVDLDKTVMLVAKRAMQVLLAWQYVRKGKFDQALNALGLTKRNFNVNTASAVWLELSYAWIPLLTDIFNAVEVTKDLFNDPLKHHTYAKRRVKEGLWVPSISGNSNDWEKIDQKNESLCEVETKFRFRIDNALLAYIAGFQLSNPLYIFWVAMPFTFVVDWFLPIGDWLGSLTATLGLTFVDGYQTTKSWGSARVTARRKRSSVPAIWGTKVQNITSAISQVEYAYIQRVPFTGFPMSYTYFKFPFSSPQRIASAIALTQTTARLR